MITADTVKQELLADGFIDAPGFEQYCGQVAVEREAARRIADEGLVVADPKGNPIPHPAVEIQRRAQAEIRAWSSQFTKRATGAPRVSGF